MNRVWYFAYGSNLCAEVFHGNRGIQPLRAVPARLDGWRLVFDKPPLFAIGESYANLLADHDATAFGVLYEISAEDLLHVELTEGVLIGNYQAVDVQVTPLRHATEPSASLLARTLVSDKREASLCPSHRYMELVIAGAVAHGLPEVHLEFLRSIPSRPSTPEAEELRLRLNDLMRKPS